MVQLFAAMFSRNRVFHSIRVVPFEQAHRLNLDGNFILTSCQQTFRKWRCGSSKIPNQECFKYFLSALDAQDGHALTTYATVRRPVRGDFECASGLILEVSNHSGRFLSCTPQSTVQICIPQRKGNWPPGFADARQTKRYLHLLQIVDNICTDHKSLTDYFSQRTNLT